MPAGAGRCHRTWWCSTVRFRRVSYRSRSGYPALKPVALLVGRADAAKICVTARLGLSVLSSQPIMRPDHTRFVGGSAARRRGEWAGVAQAGLESGDQW